MFKEHGVETVMAQKASSHRDPLEIPKELWLLVDHLYKFGINEVRLGRDFRERICKRP